MRQFILGGVLLAAGCGSLGDEGFSPRVNYNQAMATSVAAPISPILPSQAPLPAATQPTPPPPPAPAAPATPAAATAFAPASQQTLPAAANAQASLPPAAAQPMPTPKPSFFGRVADKMSDWYQRIRNRLGGSDDE